MGKRKRSAKKATPAATPPARHTLFTPRRLALAGLVIATVAVVGTATALLAAGGGGGPASTTKTAVIVDQLSLTQPNPDFIASARGLLAKSGYLTDYYHGEQVTVDFYRTLPKRGYDLIILRAHAGITTEIDASSGEKTQTEYVSLFTGEPYSKGKYPEEQLNRLGKAQYYEGADPLFGIGPRFVDESMEGSFDGALIVMMGCDGLRSQRTAQAFLDRGAAAFVSWSQPVSSEHTDTATQELLERLLVEGLPPAEAVSQTAADVGPDPVYEGELRILQAGG